MIIYAFTYMLVYMISLIILGIIITGEPMIIRVAGVLVTISLGSVIASLLMRDARYIPNEKFMKAQAILLVVGMVIFTIMPESSDNITLVLLGSSVIVAIITTISVMIAGWLRRQHII